MPKIIRVSILIAMAMARYGFADERAVDFARDVAPIIEKNCILCHKGESESGLDLTARDGLFNDNWVVGGDPGASPLLEVVTSVAGQRPQMPKTGNALSDSQVDVLRQWIQQGAKWPGDAVLPILWSLNAVRTELIPPATPTGNAENSVDAFIAKRLSEAGLKLSPPASRRVLIRRLSYDLLGLPPSPEEIDAFVRDQRPDAWERLIDRMLASPHYGERWGQHWLDIVRFSESNGYEDDAPRPHAWPYRDYVIGSFNSDKSYDQFVREQIAGDAQQHPTPESIIATGMLVLGPFDHAAAVSTSKTEQLRAREVMLEELVTTVSQSLLGLTVNCARCHDHKFDPIRQIDYYRIKAVFEGVHQAEKSAFTAQQIVDPRQELEWQFHQDEVKRAEQVLSRIRDRIDQVNDTNNLKPLNAAVAIWQHDGTGAKGGADWEKDRRGGQSDIQSKWTARFGVPATTKIAAVNSDQKVLDAGAGTLLRNEKGGAGYAIIPSIDGSELVPPPGPVSIFARVRYTGSFRGTEDVFRIGDRGDRQRDTIGFEVVAETKSGESESKLARARFVVTGEGQTREVGVQTAAKLQLDHWYDLVGVFEPLGDDNGKMTLFVRDANTGEPIGRPSGGPIDRDVKFSALSSAPRQNLLFFVAPSFQNGPQPGAQMDLSAVWHRALSKQEIGWLSARNLDDIPSNRETNTEVVKLLNREIERLEQQLQDLHENFDEPPLALIGLRKTPGDTVIYERGDVTRPTSKVRAGGIAAVTALSDDFELYFGSRDDERRLALAEWLTDSRNPLTARVIVNRIWHHHFGSGFVDTPSDFGVNGSRPTHPELLDYLTAQFIHNDDWSIKKLHRRILRSATWQQSSGFDDESAARDGGNRLLWRYPPRRLDAESVRDSMLCISGQLNRELRGPSFQPFTTTRFNTTFYHLVDKADSQTSRRTVYRMNINTGRDPLLDSLDCPAPSVLTPTRQQTITPLQALALMNDTFVLRQATELSKLVDWACQNERQQISLAWRRTLGREPTDSEQTTARKILAESDLETLCWVLLNTSEFLQIR